MSPRRSLGLLALALSVAACGSAPKKKSDEPKRAEDPWDKTPHSDEWLHATRDVPSGHESECKGVVKWIEGEKECRGKMCSHAKDLAKDWLSRCESYDEPHLEGIRDLYDSFKKRAKEEQSPCGREAEEILRGSCGKDKTCKTTAEDWGTKCGKLDGTPLVVRMMERVVERKLDGEKFKMDARGCDDMLAEIAKGSACAQQFACEEALSGVDAYRKRCDAGETPSLGPAVLIAAISQGAGRPTAVPAKASKLTDKQMATALEDGSGAALWVCGTRTTDLATYVAKRRDCKDGDVVYAKGFKKDDQLEVRTAKLPFTNDVEFAARFPSLAVHGEHELRDAQSLAAFEAKLADIAKLGADGATPLVRLVIEHASALRRSAAFREALGSKDGALSAALGEIGKRKAAAAKGRLTVAELAGLHGRAETRAFADLSAEGTVSVGASTRAAELETAELLPKAMEAYRDAYKPAQAVAKTRKVDKRTAELAKAYGKIQATGCGSAQKALSGAEQAYLACAFGVTSCDDAKKAGILSDLDKARKDAEAARHNLDVVMTGAAAQFRSQLVEISTTEGCFEPWW